MKITDQEHSPQGKRIKTDCTRFLCKAYEVGCLILAMSLHWNKLNNNVFHRRWGVQGKLRKNPENQETSIYRL